MFHLKSKKKMYNILIYIISFLYIIIYHDMEMILSLIHIISSLFPTREIEN